jgi:hypothetical protein
MNIIAERPVLGLVEDMERDDDARGPEPEPEAVFWQLVQQLVLAPVGASGQCSDCGGWFEDWNGGVCDACQLVRKGHLAVVAQQMPDDGDDACPLCGNWTCTC